MNHARLFKLVVLSVIAMTSRSLLAQEWDAKFAGIRQGAIGTAEVGYSGAPRATYQVGVSEGFSVGGAMTLDFGYKSPDAAGDFGILLSAPMRMPLLQKEKLAIGLLLDPGIGLFFSNQFRFGVLLAASGNVGYRLSDTFTIGGGVDLPIALIFSPTFVALVPILIGPVAELRVTEAVAVTLEFKVGPLITAAEQGGGTRFGMNLNAGVAYAF